MMDKKKLQNWYNIEARFYSFWRDQHDAPIIRHISSRLNALQRKDLTILDVACGSGFFSIGICDKLRNACTIVGVDFVQNLIRVAHNKSKSKVTLKPFFVVADAERMPFRRSAFNLAIAGGFFPHLESYQTFLAELSRVQTPGSLFFIIEFSPQANFISRLFILALATAFRAFTFFFQNSVSAPNGDTAIALSISGS